MLLVSSVFKNIVKSFLDYTSDVVEARHGLTHQDTYFSTILVISDHMLEVVLG